jgi:hypothetical protein
MMIEADLILGFPVSTISARIVMLAMLRRSEGN